MRDRPRERGWDTGRGDAGSSQGAQCGTRSQNLGSSPEPQTGTQPLSHPGIPGFFFNKSDLVHAF